MAASGLPTVNMGGSVGSVWSSQVSGWLGLKVFPIKQRLYSAGKVPPPTVINKVPYTSNPYTSN